MLKEKCEKAKHYVKKYRKEIAVVAVGSVAVGVIGCKHYNHLVKLKDIAKRSLTREYERNNIEIRKIQESIERLKPNAININYRIPERMKRIAELELYNKEILKDINEL